MFSKSKFFRKFKVFRKSEILKSKFFQKFEVFFENLRFFQKFVFSNSKFFRKFKILSSKFHKKLCTTRCNCLSINVKKYLVFCKHIKNIEKERKKIAVYIYEYVSYNINWLVIFWCQCPRNMHMIRLEILCNIIYTTSTYQYKLHLKRIIVQLITFNFRIVKIKKKRCSCLNKNMDIMSDMTLMWLIY